MNMPVTRSCGHRETYTVQGRNAASWKDQEKLLKATPCADCHRKQIKERVKNGN